MEIHPESGFTADMVKEFKQGSGKDRVDIESRAGENIKKFQ
jgi:hypothetical protein